MKWLVYDPPRKEYLDYVGVPYDFKWERTDQPGRGFTSKKAAEKFIEQYDAHHNYKNNIAQDLVVRLDETPFYLFEAYVDTGDIWDHPLWYGDRWWYITRLFTKFDQQDKVTYVEAELTPRIGSPIQLKFVDRPQVVPFTHQGTSGVRMYIPREKKMSKKAFYVVAGRNKGSTSLTVNRPEVATEEEANKIAEGFAKGSEENEYFVLKVQRRYARTNVLVEQYE